MNKLPHISFGMIVLNGEPFVRYNLRALYPFAHEIIVVEGAALAAAGIATPDGHSTDSTLETLYRFKAEEDPDDKLIIITREGFWEGEKDEMSQAYAQRATGDYLWQVDSDEFYSAEDMQAVLDMLRDDPEITAVSFKMITFWGGFDYLCDGYYLRGGANIYHRLFKWGPNYTYVTHRPPTVHNPQGHDLRTLKWVDGPQLAERGIIMYHYSLLFPKQVIEKCKYYSSVEWVERDQAQVWAQDIFMNLKDPFRVHNVYDFPSWLMRFKGRHPEQIEAMRSDINNGTLEVAERRVDDIEHVLSLPSYKIGRLRLQYAPRIESWIEITKDTIASTTTEIAKFQRRVVASAKYRSQLLWNRLLRHR